MRVTNPTPVSREEFRQLFHPSVHIAIAKSIDDPETLGVVCFENLQLDSSEAGKRSALVYGPKWTYKDLDTILDGRLGDVPSRFQYPVHYFVKHSS